jgi:hypothetical protein
LKGESVSLYKYCKYCGEEHIKTTNPNGHFYIYYPKYRKTPHFSCKKERSYTTIERQKKYPEKKRERQKKYTLRHPDRMKSNRKAYRTTHKDKIKVYARNKGRKDRDQLTDKYIAACLRMKVGSIPSELISLKREHIKLIRLIKQK